MLTIRVQYRRQWQDVPYWHQVADLTVEGETVEEVLKAATPENLQRLAQVYRRMEQVGDALVSAQLAKPHPRDLPAEPVGSSAQGPRRPPMPPKPGGAR